MRQALFLEAELTVEVAEGAEIGAALGRRERDGSPDHTAFNFGVAFEPVRNVNLDVRYDGTNRRNEGEQFRPDFVVAIRVRF